MKSSRATSATLTAPSPLSRTQVLTQALAAGFKLALIAETCSDPSDDVISCLLQQLPPDVAAAARVYSTSMARQPVGQVSSSCIRQQSTWSNIPAARLCVVLCYVAVIRPRMLSTATHFQVVYVSMLNVFVRALMCRSPFGVVVLHCRMAREQQQQQQEKAAAAAAPAWKPACLQQPCE